jgi:hypothetical protein
LQQVFSSCSLTRENWKFLKDKIHRLDVELEQLRKEEQERREKQEKIRKAGKLFNALLIMRVLSQMTGKRQYPPK